MNPAWNVPVAIWMKMSWRVKAPSVGMGMPSKAELKEGTTVETIKLMMKLMVLMSSILPTFELVTTRSMFWTASSNLMTSSVELVEIEN